MTDLVQVVDLTVPEAAGIRGFTYTTNDGKHYVALVEETGTCDACIHDEARITEQDGTYVVNDQPVYRIKGVIQTSLLCRDHLEQQPTHIDLRDTVPQETNG